MIPQLPLITVTPRLPNERLWFLVGKQADGSISPTETLELDCLCRVLETEQELAREDALRDSVGGRR